MRFGLADFSLAEDESIASGKIPFLWGDLFRDGFVLTSISKLDNLAAITLGGPAFRRGREEPECLTFFCQLQSKLAACIGFTTESLGDCRRTTHYAELQNFNFKLVGVSFDAQQVAKADVAPRLGRLAVALNPAEIASPCSHGACLEKPRGPKPFVNANARHSYSGAFILVTKTFQHTRDFVAHGNRAFYFAEEQVSLCRIRRQFIHSGDDDERKIGMTGFYLPGKVCAGAAGHKLV